MKAIVTGAGGFIGTHLVELLLANNIDVYCIVRNDKKNLDHVKNRIKISDIDINDKLKIEKFIKSVKPDYIFHLAAQAYVMPSWADIESTFRTNINGTLNILDAAKKNGLDPVIVVACSSAEYGFTRKDEIPIKEDKEFRPSSPYAVSKIGTDMVSYLYWRAYGTKVIRVRLFNTVGPRKKGSAVADFAEMIAKVEKGTLKSMGVGNLDAVLDFTDGRDAVRAFLLLAQKGKHGEAYNVCSGKGYKLKDILDKMIKLSTKKIDVYQDEKKYRPLEDPVFIGDNSKIKKLGWAPKIPIDTLLKDTLDYWRHNVK